LLALVVVLVRLGNKLVDESQVPPIVPLFGQPKV
jgi:hypothetical protein